MSPKIPKWSRRPTPDEITRFTGMHCAKKYKHVAGTSWRCPCCDRSAYELIRWTYIKGPSWRAAYGDEHGMGFTIGIHEHHCHGNGRFAPTWVCGECNWADGAAKRKLNLPRHWSFTPQEIARFVKTYPYSGKTDIDYDIAKEIYDRRPISPWSVP